MTYHIVNGKKTDVGHNVHYVDHAGVSHAATITDLEDKHGVSHADLKVVRREHGREDYLENVPHSATGAPHTWTHIPD
jgi:hypothetical protein